MISRGSCVSVDDLQTGASHGQRQAVDGASFVSVALARLLQSGRLSVLKEVLGCTAAFASRCERRLGVPAGPRLQLAIPALTLHTS